jgi:predicted  nucleic acid-binding Zn-ribbon protein
MSPYATAWRGDYGGDPREQEAVAYESAMRGLKYQIDAGEFQLDQLRERYEELEAEYEALRDEMDERAAGDDEGA